MKEIREQITVTGFQRSRLFKFLLFPPVFSLISARSPERNSTKTRNKRRHAKRNPFPFKTYVPANLYITIHRALRPLTRRRAGNTTGIASHQPPRGNRDARVQSTTKRSHAVLLSRVIRATIVRIRCLINSWMVGQRLKCRYTPTPGAHESPGTCVTKGSLLFPLSLSLSMLFRHGCVRACPGLSRLLAFVARLGWVPTNRHGGTERADIIAKR